MGSFFSLEKRKEFLLITWHYTNQDSALDPKELFPVAHSAYNMAQSSSHRIMAPTSKNRIFYIELWKFFPSVRSRILVPA